MEGKFRLLIITALGTTNGTFLRPLYQAQNKLKAVIHLFQPRFGKRANFLLDAAFVNRLDLSNVDDTLARKVGFALV